MKLRQTTSKNWVSFLKCLDSCFLALQFLDKVPFGSFAHMCMSKGCWQHQQKSLLISYLIYGSRHRIKRKEYVKRFFYAAAPSFSEARETLNRSSETGVVICIFSNTIMRGGLACLVLTSGLLMRSFVVLSRSTPFLHAKLKS